MCLKESITIDNKKLLTKSNIQISSTEIKKNNMSYDLKHLWIDTIKDDKMIINQQMSVIKFTYLV